MMLGVRNPQSIACEVWSLRLQDMLCICCIYFIILLLLFTGAYVYRTNRSLRSACVPAHSKDNGTRQKAVSGSAQRRNRIH